MKVEYFLDNVSIGEQKDGHVPKVGQQFLVAKDALTNINSVVASVVFKRRGIDVFFEAV